MSEFWNNKVFDKLGNLFDILVLGILWLIFCIPIVTVIPSSAAFYHSMAKAVRKQRSYVIREFFHSLKINLASGIGVTLLYLIAAAVLYTCVDVANAVGSSTGFAKFYYVGTGILTLILVYITLFFIPVFSRFQMKISHAFRLSLYLASKNLLRMIPWVITLAGFAVLCYIAPILILVLPAIYTWFYTGTMEKILQKQMEDMGLIDEEAKKQWYYDSEDEAE